MADKPKTNAGHSILCTFGKDDLKPDKNCPRCSYKIKHGRWPPR